MTSSDYRAIIARNWLEKATSTIEIAEVSFEKNNLVSCVNRMYYAAFYAVCSILVHDGKEYGKHTAVRSALNRDLIKTGRIPTRFGDYYNKLFDDRLAGDYEPATSFSNEEVGDFLTLTKEFVALCCAMVNSRINPGVQ